MAFIKQSSNESVSQDERKSPREFVDLVAGLEDSNPSARRWAARDLADYPDATAALVAHLPLEQDVSVRAVIFSTLVKLSDPAAIDALVKCLRSDDASLRNEAVEVMKQLPDEVAPIMGNLLKDPDPDTRIFAVNILESLRHPGVVEWLIGVIDQDPHVNVCGTAVDLLSELGTSDATTALAGLKARFPDEPYIQFCVDLALRRIREGS